MQLLNNKMSLTRYFPKKPITGWSQLGSGIEVGLIAGRFFEHKLDLGESNFGWAIYGNERNSKVDFMECIVGKYFVFSMRMDTLGLDPTEFKMRVAERTAECQRLSESETISSREKAEIKESVTEEMAEFATVKTRNFTVILDCVHNQVFFSGASATATDAFESMFSKCFDSGLQMANAIAVAVNLAHKDDDLDELPVIDKILNEPGWEYTDLGLEVHPEFEDSYEGKLGSSMLTMFFYWCETLGERCDVSMMAQDSLELSGEAMGAKTVTIKGGAWTTCQELGQSLKMGKRVSKMRLVFGEAGGEEELVYYVSLDKQNFTLSNIEVAKEKEGPVIARNQSVLRRISRTVEILDSLVLSFIHLRYGDEKYWEIERDNVRHWIEKF